MGILSSFFGGGGAAKKAAALEAQAQQRAADRIARQQSLIREDLNPYRQAGQDALRRYTDMVLGGDYSNFYTSPGYQFRFDEGQRALETGAAARGNLFSGNTAQALQRYGQDLASQEYQNYLNQITPLYQQGYNAAVQGGQLGLNAAMAQAPYLAGVGEAEAGGILGKAAQLAQGGQNILALGSAALGAYQPSASNWLSQFGTNLRSTSFAG